MMVEDKYTRHEIPTKTVVVIIVWGDGVEKIQKFSITVSCDEINPCFQRIQISAFQVNLNVF